MSETLEIDRILYNGNGLALTSRGTPVLVPFTLPGETVEVSPPNASNEAELLCVITPSPERVGAPCPHFGTCGGCHYQMANYPEQVRLKQSIFAEIVRSAGIDSPPEPTVHSAEPWGYRNRIRLRVARTSLHGDEEQTEGTLRLGYNRHGTTEFLPVTTCLIAAPVLWSTAKSILAAAAEDKDAAYWLNAAAEVELFCDHTMKRVQVTLFCAPRTKPIFGSLDRMAIALQAYAPQGVIITATAAAAFDPRTGPTGRLIAEAGAPGLNYRVLDETYWITRGGFFQVNRFLLDTLVQLVCDDQDGPRSGDLAWDLFAGVGLFSRVLARSFTRVTSVEANPTAVSDLRTTLPKRNPESFVYESTTLDFLRFAILQRDRPDLVVLDPPRAGVGTEACELLARIAPPVLVYVSCDPTTLARDLVVLQAHYIVRRLHLVDLFPQTFHLETVAILERKSSTE
ncbi:MAG: 23S rRNA (uracil(1939)-C(5))-methyltransferase RlmD [Acidobacteriaceae bacterium]